MTRWFILKTQPIFFAKTPTRRMLIWLVFRIYLAYRRLSYALLNSTLGTIMPTVAMIFAFGRLMIKSRLSLVPLFKILKSKFILKKLRSGYFHVTNHSRNSICWSGSCFYFLCSDQALYLMYLALLIFFLIIFYALHIVLPITFHAPPKSSRWVYPSICYVKNKDGKI